MSKQDKTYRKVLSIMDRYYYRGKIQYSVQVFREYRLAKLLGKKTKPLPTFGGVPINSKEHNERLFVFNYYKKLGYDDKYVSGQWRKAEDNKRERQRNRIY